MVPKHGLPGLDELPNVAIEPTRRGRPRKFMQGRCSASPEEPNNSKDDERDEEGREAKKRQQEHPEEG